MREPSAQRVLAAVAGLAWLAVALDFACPSAPAPVTGRSLLPELRAADVGVAALEWHRHGQLDVRLDRGPDGAFRIPGLDQSLIDQRAVTHVLDSLETLGYARQLDASPSDQAGAHPDHGLRPAGTSLRVMTTDGRLLVLFFGRREADIDRVFATRALIAADRVASSATLSDQDLFARAEGVYLIDGHAARSLDVSEPALRDRRVVPVPWDAITALQITTYGSDDARAEGRASGPGTGRQLAISGRLPRLQLTGEAAAPWSSDGHQDAPGAAAITVDPRRWRATLQALVELELERFLPTDAAAPDASAATKTPPMRLDIVARGRADGDAQRFHVVALGPCPVPEGAGLELVETAIGTGCLERERLRPLTQAVADPTSLVSRAVLFDRPVRLVFDPDGRDPVTIRADGRAYAWDRDTELESQAVDQWLGALEQAPGRLVPASDIDQPALRPALRFDVTYPGGQRQRIQLLEHPRLGLLARRDDEPVYTTLGRDERSRDLADVSPTRFARRQLLALDPYSLRRVERWRRGALEVRLVRGELLEDWRVEVPEGATLEAGSVAELRELARLRARSFLRSKPTRADRLEPPLVRLRLVFDPALGSDEPLVHQLDIGARSDQGCVARLNGEGPVFSLSRGACAAAATGWVRGEARRTSER